MKLKDLSTSELLSYSVIMENIISTNLEIQREISEAVSGKFCTNKEIETIFNKSVDAKEEADTIYAGIQKELDLRSKRDLGMKFGIRRSQSIIKELDTFAKKRNAELMAQAQAETEKAKAISEETIELLENNENKPASMQVLKDDTVQ